MSDETSTAGQPGGGPRERIGARAWVRSTALVGSGLVAGGILAGSLVAHAAEERPTPSSEQSGCEGRGHGGPGAGEEALTGDIATSVEEAVLAAYPDATIGRLETDADGVYEAHLITVDGERLTVELDEGFAVTGTEADRGPGGPGRGPGGGRGGGPGDEALTGDIATSVEEAVLAEYPDATVERLGTDADGVYEAHITTADGERLTVELDEEFAITGTE